MKTTKLLGIFLLFMLSQSCSKDPYNPGCGTKQTYYYTLTGNALKQTPYFTNPAFDTISFASDKGDTITFVKTKTDTTWYYEKGNGDPDCGYDKNYYQTIHNTYYTIKGIGVFDVKHIKENKYSSTFVQVKFNNLIFYYDDVAIDDNSFPRFIGEVIKNNKIFKQTLYSYNNYSDSSSAISYMNKDYGLFYIDDKLNNLKYLINK